MPDWPLIPLYCFLVVVACARGGGTYLLGRGARSVADRRTSLAERAAVRRGEQLISRYGAPAVTLCFLTVGVQTAVNAAAGSLRMPARRYLPALVLGALIWAGIYVSVGMAVLEAFWGGAWWVAIVVVVAAVAVAAGVHRLLDRGPEQADQDSSAAGRR
ncbi:hypothetical protein FXB39_08875 [Nocardioides sp. BGMRC 2183]|nr:hypothetical protein FXB39_08875 [Nocardioides sp. BGMRC 2183]